MRTKPIVGALIAVGMTLTLAGTAQSSTPSQDRELRISAADDALEAQRAADGAALRLAESESDETRVIAARKKCVTKKQMKKIRMYMPLTKVRKILKSKGKKVSSGSGYTYYQWKLCVDKDQYFEVDVAKKKKKSKPVAYRIYRSDWI